MRKIVLLIISLFTVFSLQGLTYAVEDSTVTPSDSSTTVAPDSDSSTVTSSDSVSSDEKTVTSSGDTTSLEAEAVDTTKESSIDTIGESVPVNNNKNIRPKINLNKELGSFSKNIEIVFRIISLLWMVFFGFFYITMSLGLYRIAKELGATAPWLARVPIINMYLIFKLGERPIWQFILCFIPILNIIAIFYYIGALHTVLKKFGYGVITTILVLFFPYVGFPIIGDKMNKS
ncbi:MAG: DUF5684 domain-containing protein [Candidatus Gracilibacteria bacterium]|nr:DUF5684 domain-containing protein [Candidatus Gracilibacteria bacterium]MDD3120149.1 DUF5684 domain-containing protein [Candidatus Gracilibacteria bacterium]